MRTRSLIFAAVFLQISSSAYADSTTVNGIKWYYKVENNGTATLYDEAGGHVACACISTDTAGAITIPSVLGGHTVSKIGEFAFLACSKVTSITIPSSVTSIDEYAFCRCTGLTSLMIPENVTAIGNCLFSGCTGLTHVDFPSWVSNVPEGTFRGCTSISGDLSVLPATATRIEADTFAGCNFASLRIPKRITYIGPSAFSASSA